MKIKDIKGEQSRVDVEGEITLIMPVKTVNLRAGGNSSQCDALLNDNSGSIRLSLWGDQVNQIKVGDHIAIANGYVVMRHGEPELNIGRYGKLTKTVHSDSHGEYESEDKQVSISKGDTPYIDRDCPFCGSTMGKDIDQRGEIHYWCENRKCIAYCARFDKSNLEIVFRYVE